MRPHVDIVDGDTELPAEADAVVIGGGIIGVSTAWTLARRGLSVVLCEKGRIGGEQSSRNWGFCRQQGRDPREIPADHRKPAHLARSSRRRSTRRSASSRQAVSTLAATDDDQANGYDEWLEHAKPYQLDSAAW